jgi:hypothetical protein
MGGLGSGYDLQSFPNQNMMYQDNHPSFATQPMQCASTEGCGPGGFPEYGSNFNTDACAQSFGGLGGQERFGAGYDGFASQGYPGGFGGQGCHEGFGGGQFQPQFDTGCQTNYMDCNSGHFGSAY